MAADGLDMKSPSEDSYRNLLSRVRRVNNLPSKEELRQLQRLIADGSAEHCQQNDPATKRALERLQELLL